MKIFIESWDSFGNLCILISARGKVSRYEYQVDIARIPGWERRIHHQPGKVLNEIKRTAKHVTLLAKGGYNGD